MKNIEIYLQYIIDSRLQVKPLVAEGSRTWGKVRRIERYTDTGCCLVSKHTVEATQCCDRCESTKKQLVISDQFGWSGLLVMI